MNQQIFGLTLTPERLRMIAALFFAAVTLYLISQSPWNEFSNYLQLRQKIEQQQEKIQEARSIPLTRAELLARRQQIVQSIEALRAKFPPRNQILSILLVDLSQMFHDSGVQLVSFEPSSFEPLTEGGVKDLGRIHVKIEATGQYPDFIALFDKLSRYDRIVQVESPSIVPAGSGGGSSDSSDGGDSIGGDGSLAVQSLGFNRTLDVHFTMTTFALSH